MSKPLRFSEDPNPKMVIPITIEHVIEHKRLSDLLVGAFEGGSNGWYWIERFIEPRSMPRWVQNDKLGLPRHAWYPLTRDGGLLVSGRTAQAEETDGPMFLSRRDPAYKQWLHDHVRPTKGKLLNLRAVTRGVQIMAQKYPHHFKAFVDEDDDATTADVFLQCAVLGDVIYG